MNQILLDLGLTENENNIYLGLLSTPNVTAAELSRRLKMDKSSAYRAVETLVTKGLVFASPEKKGTTYTANGPEALKTLYKNKLLELNSKEHLLNSFIDNLLKETNKNRDTYIKVEYGLEAVRAVMEESLQSKEKLIRERFRRHPFFNNKEHVLWVFEHAKRRIANKVFIRELEYNLEFNDTDLHKLMKTENLHFKEVRQMPKQIDDNNSVRIWDDTVNIVSFDEKQEFIVITIKDKFVAQLMKNMYDFVWDQSKDINS